MITVVICTYNRADSLAETLKSLCQQKQIEGIEWELLVIDNNCTDHTARVIDVFRSRLPLRSLVEHNQGLSYGRNRAILEAKGDLLIFTDDDVRVDPGWLKAYSDAMNKYTDTGYFGGPITPFWPEGRPGWVRDINMPLLAGLFGNYRLGENSHNYAKDDMHPFGANFALRRTLFTTLSPFRVDLGVSGSTPGRGEEMEYFKRARELGTKGVYVAEAQLQHRVDPDHLSLKFMYRFGIQKGLSARAIQGDSRKGSRKSWLEYLLKGIYQLVKGRGDRFRQCLINMGIQHGLFSSQKKLHNG